MANPLKQLALLSVLLLGLSLQGCAATSRMAAELPPAPVALYLPTAADAGQELLLRYAPWLVVEDYQYDFNRIGTPSARPDEEEGHAIYIDTGRPAIYTQTQYFSSGGSDYTNLIYRVHFPEVPWPHLTLGRNVGLLVYVTLNDRREPILITTLHTCGCYLAMFPTSNLPLSGRPSGWPEESQEVYGETLPARLELADSSPAGRLVITLRGETHRVRNVAFRDEGEITGLVRLPAPLQPMSALERLALGGETVSFFEQSGWRKGYVKGSNKPLERVFVSWWALDPLVGEDKALGPPETTGTTMYTSLKFWARKASNIWDFPSFLNYWGWRLGPDSTDDSRLQPLVSR